MNTQIETSSALILTPAQKAARTKGATSHKAAGIKAQISKLLEVADSVRGQDRAAVTRKLRKLEADLSALGHEHDELAA